MKNVQMILLASLIFWGGFAQAKLVCWSQDKTMKLSIIENFQSEFGDAFIWTQSAHGVHFFYGQSHPNNTAFSKTYNLNNTENTLSIIEVLPPIFACGRGGCQCTRAGCPGDPGFPSGPSFPSPSLPAEKNATLKINGEYYLFQCSPFLAGQSH